MAGWVLVKWGGSLITDKAKPDSLRATQLTALAAELGAVRRVSPYRILLGHGGGSFGHVAAKQAGLHRGRLAVDRWPGVSRTQQRVAVLHRHVVEALTAAAVEPYSLVPSSYATAWRGSPEAAAVSVLDAALAAPLLPVTYGDVVLDRDWGASIASTEALFGLWIERILDRGDSVRCVVWMGETNGVLDATGHTIPTLTPETIGKATDQATGSGAQGDSIVTSPRGTDVTGGMDLRLRTAARFATEGIPSWIVNGTGADTLAGAIEGRPVPGTKVMRAG